MPLLPPLLFCPKCTRYIGVEMRCKYCSYERPNSKRVPKEGQALWQVKTAHEPAGRPCLVGDLLYACDKGGALYAINVTSGEATQLFEGGGAWRSEMIVREKRAYLAARAGSEVVSLNLSLLSGEGRGEVAWRFKTDGHASGVAADERRVYVGDAEGKVYALNDLGARCEEAWPKTSVGQRVSTAPVRWRHLLLVATHHHQGKLIALDASRGQEVWARDLTDRCALSPLLITTKDKASAFVVTEQGKIFNFRLSDGEQEWQRDLKIAINAPPVTDGRFIYLGSNSGKVMALDAAQREPGWVTDLGMGKVGGITVWEGFLFVAGADGALCILDLKSGALLQRHQVAGGITAGPIISPDGMVFVGSGSKGWIALPWHLGGIEWAHTWCVAHKHHLAAAAFSVLCHRADEAERLWLEAKHYDLAARFRAGTAKSKRAAEIFEQATEYYSDSPGRVAAFWINAADQWWREGNSANYERCSKEAAKINPTIAHLRIVDNFNNPQFEAGESGALAVQVQNVGEGEAKEIQFFLGGDLHRIVHGTFEKLPAGQSAFIEFEGLIPTIAGAQRPLTIALQYRDEASEQRTTDFKTQIFVAPPAPGQIVVEGDAGVVVVRVSKDAPPPKVKVKGSVGLVKYEIM